MRGAPETMVADGSEWVGIGLCLDALWMDRSGAILAI